MRYKLKLYILIIKADYSFQTAVSWLKLSVYSRQPPRFGLNPRPVHATSAVDKGAVGQDFSVFSEYFSFLFSRNTTCVTKTNRRSLGIFKQRHNLLYFGQRSIEKHFHTVFS